MVATRGKYESETDKNIKYKESEGLRWLKMKCDTNGSK